MNFIDTTDYVFLDLGCSSGGSLEAYGRRFNAEGRGLGLDSSREKVAAARAKGLNAEACDIRSVEISQRVLFCVMSHLLEHLPSPADAAQVIRKACGFSRRFVLIRQPYFDADATLFREGFKLYWSDWRGHPNPMTMLQLHNVVRPLIEKGTVRRFNMYGVTRITSSLDDAVHNLDSPTDALEWQRGRYSPKRELTFDFPVYREVVAVLDMNGRSVERVEAVIREPYELLFTSDVTSGATNSRPGVGSSPTHGWHPS